MKFFHLSDLHIGKHLHHYNLKEDQKKILGEIVCYARELSPDAIIIAGDIYDKSVPSAEAVEMFDDFLTSLAEIEPVVPVFIISGNHDSPERLEYAGNILKKNHIYMAGKVPEDEEEYLQKVVLEDEYGAVFFYLLPFFKPSYIRGLVEKVPENYTEAVKLLLKRENIDYKMRNVLVSHQFYTTGTERPETCDSESISVGGLDNVDTSAVRDFDYVALGHIHGRQSTGYDHIRYCGTPLKYSVSEWNHKKTLTVVTLEDKGTPVKVTEFELHPLRDVKKITGALEEVIKQADANDRNDYVSITLTDEIEPYRPKDRLEEVYSKILEIRIDNTRTRNKLHNFEEEVKEQTPFEVFEEFYQEIQGNPLDEKQKAFVLEIMEKLGEE